MDILVFHFQDAFKWWRILWTRVKKELLKYRSVLGYRATKIWIHIGTFFFLSTDLKLHLQSTDYGNFLANEASPLQVSVIDDKLRDKLVTEFQHMRNHAVEPLGTFLDYITYGLVMFIVDKTLALD